MLVLTKYLLLNFVVISATAGGVLDRAIGAEDEQHKDFLRLVCIRIQMCVAGRLGDRTTLSSHFLVSKEIRPNYIHLL